MSEAQPVRIAHRWSLSNLFHYSTMLGFANLIMLPFLMLVGAIQVPDEHAYIVWGAVVVQSALSLFSILHRPVVAQ